MPFHEATNLGIAACKNKAPAIRGGLRLDSVCAVFLGESHQGRALADFIANFLAEIFVSREKSTIFPVSRADSRFRVTIEPSEARLAIEQAVVDTVEGLPHVR